MSSIILSHFLFPPSLESFIKQQRYAVHLYQMSRRGYKRPERLSDTSDEGGPAKRPSQGPKFGTPQSGATASFTSPRPKSDALDSSSLGPEPPVFDWDHLYALDPLLWPPLTNNDDGSETPISQPQELSNHDADTATEAPESFKLFSLDSCGLKSGRYMSGIPRHMDRPILGICASFEEDGSIRLSTKIIHPTFADWRTSERHHSNEVARRLRIASAIGARLQNDVKLSAIAIASFQIAEIECSEIRSRKDPRYFTKNGTVKGAPFLPKDDPLKDVASRGLQLFQLYYNRHLAKTQLPNDVDFSVARTITKNAYDCLDDDRLLQYKDHFVTGTGFANGPQMTWLDKWPKKLKTIRGEEPTPSPRVIFDMGDLVSRPSQTEVSSPQ